MLLGDKPSCAAGLDLLREVFVVLRACEDHRDMGTDALHGLTDSEAVVVSELDVEQQGVRLVTLHRLDRTGGTRCLPDDFVTTCIQQTSYGFPEDRVIIHDDKSYATVLVQLRASG